MVITKSDPSLAATPTAAFRAVENEPMQLRLWGTDRVYPLPTPRAPESWIGTSPECWLLLHDRQRFISRRHAVVKRVGHAWKIADGPSKNGLWVDGERVAVAHLAPGTEIGVGRVRLVVETPALVRRRALLGRLLGWHADQQVIVDRALRALRQCDLMRAPLWLAGNDNLIAIARRIHCEVTGEEQSFAFIDIGASTRSREAALRVARGGTLCAWLRRPPADIDAARTLAGECEGACRLVICSRSADQVGSIDIPPLAGRSGEIERLVAEYASDAIVKLGAKTTSFTRADLNLLLDDPPATHAEAEIATLRLVAIHEYGGVTHAAPHLGVTHSALSRWFARRVDRRRRRRASTRE